MAGNAPVHFLGPSAGPLRDLNVLLRVEGTKTGHGSWIFLDGPQST